MSDHFSDEREQRAYFCAWNAQQKLTVGSDILPTHQAGCFGDCADSGECSCSHKDSPRGPKVPRHEPGPIDWLLSWLMAPRCDLKP